MNINLDMNTKIDLSESGQNKAFTLIEIIVAITITTIFIAIFSQLIIGLNSEMNEKQNKLVRHNQLLVSAIIFDNIVRYGDIELIASSTAPSLTADLIISSSTKFEPLFIFNLDENIDLDVSSSTSLCGVHADLDESNKALSCIFPKKNRAPLIVNLLELEDFGTDEVEVEKFDASELKADQYRLIIGYTDIIFGILPKVLNK